ncbi:MAG: AbrB/MazE/SpoVT family DNA-binding domain-containing protein [Deltaproteobacteria bacterium]|nr:AbrB/MazE/SpoVT family DNA-binding domain-containing protein [Deltaproteobacteria bacterium]
MITVTVSSKYQVVIPKEIREKLHIKVGQKFQILHYGDRIEFLPRKNIKRMRGFLKGIDTEIVREEDRL